MEIQVSKLREILSLLKPVVPRKSSLPVLTYVLLQDGKAVATNLEQYVVIEAAEVEGQTLMPLKEVSELLRRVPGNASLSIRAQGKSVSLKWSGGKSEYTVPQAVDYPSLPTLSPILSHSISGAQLVPALTSVLAFCSPDSSRPVLTGVSLFPGEHLQVAAADGYWMGLRNLPVGFPPIEGARALVIPSKAVEILQHLWQKGPPPPMSEGDLVDFIATKGKLLIEVGWNNSANSMMRLGFGVISLYTLLIEGNPPNFQMLVPEEAKHTVEFYAPEMESAAQLVSNIAAQGNGTVRLAWDSETMKLSAISDEMGSIEVEVPVRTSDGAGRIALNIRYLLDYLKGRQGMITMQTRDEKSPIVFRHGSSPLVLVMPMFVEWPGERRTPKAEAKVEDDEPVEETETDQEEYGDYSEYEDEERYHDEAMEQAEVMETAEQASG